MSYSTFFNKASGFMADPFGAGGTFTQAISGGPIDQSYLGGSPEEEALQRQNLAGIGAGTTAQGGQAFLGGSKTLEAAHGNAQDDRAKDQGYAGAGRQLGLAGVGGQNQAVSQARSIAAQPTDSLAQAQLRQQSDRNQAQMLGMASQARGGNQAAAMRNAQQAGSQMQLETNQQAAQLRAAEQQAAVNRRLGVEQMAAGVGGQQAGLGYGMQGQGLGMAQQSTGQLAGIGGQQVSAGLGEQQVGLGAYGLLNDRDKAKLEAERANVSANAANRNPMGMGGAILGGIFGG